MERGFAESITAFLSYKRGFAEMIASLFFITLQLFPVFFVYKNKNERRRLV